LKDFLGHQTLLMELVGLDQFGQANGADMSVTEIGIFETVEFDEPIPEFGAFFEAVVPTHIHHILGQLATTTTYSGDWWHGGETDFVWEKAW
jgi:hypothetical protein